MTSSPRPRRGDSNPSLSHSCDGGDELRFAVLRPGSPGTLPALHHRMSCGCIDVLRRVHIRVDRVSTRAASEDRLALSVLCCHVPACGATLGRISRRHQNHPAWCLVLGALEQAAPGMLQDRPVQPGLLAYIPSGRFASALRTSHHRCHPQILECHPVESPGQVGGDLLGPVLAPVCLAGLGAADGGLEPGSPLGSACGFGKASLKPRQPCSLKLRWHGAGQQLSGRQRCRDGDAAVDTHCRTTVRCRDRGRYHCERNVPASGAIPRHSVGLGPGYGAGPTKAHPANFRDSNLSHSAGQSPYVGRLDGGDPEALMPASLAPRRPAVSPCEEIGHRLTEVSQRLLLHRDRSRSQPAEHGPGLSQLTASLGEARRRTTPLCPPRLLLNAQIPHVPGMTAVPNEPHHLIGRGLQPETGHSKNLWLGNDKSLCKDTEAPRIEFRSGLSVGASPKGVR
ncbi:hypothetical protein H180DRAFT_03965 [Streptomyces sp. WMMB 322]|nr:hypothetical protein H180DRAFT_03965 [Streptomyces sp. WMMB 322]